MTAATAPGTRADWHLCDGCRSVVFVRRWVRNHGVCPECGRCGALSAQDRLTQLLDPGSAEPLEFGVSAVDPLRFTDTRPYPDRLAAARAGTGLTEAVQGAAGAVEGCPVLVACMDFRFLGGSLSCAVGEIITRIGELALRRRTPLLLVTASGGARMQEGALALMQMAKTSAMLADLDAAGVLTVSLVTDPTYGGVAASFATLCDVTVAEPGARLGFAGRRVIEQAIGERLPADFQTAEFLLDRGFIDFIAPRATLRRHLGAVLRAYRPRDGRAAAGPCQDDDGVVVREPGRLPDDDAAAVVRRARCVDRPTTLDYAALLLDEFRELAGDRVSGDCPAIVGGLGRLDGTPVMLIGHQKGDSPAELHRRNFGMPTPAGYRKAARLMRLAAKLRLPIITLIDTPGAYPGARAEEQGQMVAIAENLKLMADLPVPVVAMVTGEGGSGGALALGVANRVLMWHDAVYSVISPEGCAAILWRDPSATARAAGALKLRAADLLALGVVDGVLPEPHGGVDADPVQAAQRLRAALRQVLAELAGLDAAQLRADRRARFRRFGADCVTWPAGLDADEVEETP
ncbi:acetyl-CoA carboxylase carboxyl transferase subunit alpha [Dactylosporangium sp. NPDC049525]|uniref:acetyl-CoA carboxylase carboxyl transferase subunit alpha n=1 Tax=Dactylosporangium sp. NPDC049525 TaxID=3154730 RepID=UPI00342AC24F